MKKSTQIKNSKGAKNQKIEAPKIVGAIMNAAKTPWKYYSMLAFAFFVTSIIFYLPAYYGYFQQDEWFFIPLFSRISQHQFAPIVAFLAPFRYPQAFAFHISPVGTFLLWIEIMTLKLNYPLYITFALILHTMIGVQITALVRTLFRNHWVALLSGFMFITLSTHSQAVIWTNAHLYAQCSLIFGLASLQLFIKYVHLGRAAKNAYYGAIVFYLASLFTKESMILLVFILPFYSIIYRSWGFTLSLKLLHASTLGYLFVRFLSPKIMAMWGTDPNMIASISNKNTDPLFSIYWAVTLFLKALTQSIFSQSTITQLTEWMTEVGYPHYNVEREVRGTNYLTFTQSAGQDMVLYTIALLLIAIGYFVFKQTQAATSDDKKPLAIIFAWLVFSTLPFTFLAGWLLKLFPYISTVDSRHLYVLNVSISVLLSYLVWRIFRQIVHYKVASLQPLYQSLMALAVIGFFVYQYQSLQTQIATQNKITDGRETIVKLLKKEVPRLGEQTLFYTTSNVALYGFADMMLPFQNNPGQVILSIYAQEQKIPKDFLTAQFLMKGITEQWYQTFDGMSIGYMLDKKSLYKTVLENNIDPKNVHAISYDGNNQTARMISPQIRQELEAVIARRAQKSDWTTYSNELGSYSLLIPPGWTVVAQNTEDEQRDISILSDAGEYVMGIRIYDKAEGEPISDYVARLPEYAQYEDGQTAITFAQLKLGYLDSYTTVTNVDQALVKRYYFNTKNNLQIKEINVSTSYVSTEAGQAQVDELLYTLDFTN